MRLFTLLQEVEEVIEKTLTYKILFNELNRLDIYKFENEEWTYQYMNTSENDPIVQHFSVRVRMLVN